MAADARVVLYAADAATARNAAQLAIERLHALEAVMSDYQPTSELSRLMAAAHGQPQRISSDLYRVLAAAQELAECSDGAFDITIGPMTQLWRSAQQTGEMPDASAVAAAQRRVGWRKLILDEAGPTAMLAAEGMQLDLGGIGKGFAVDEALNLLRRQGLTRCLVALAGDIAVGDPPPGCSGWRIAVEGADDEQQPHIVELVNEAISTSGDHVQFILIEATRHSHIIDPNAKSSLGLTGTRSITIRAPNATTADGLATALSVMGPDGHDLLDYYGAAIVP